MSVPEPTVQGGVRIEFRVGVAMVKTVIAGPLNGCARGKSEDHQRTLQPLGQQQRTMGENAMVSQVHAEIG
jgi:uncharacterized protein YbjQ (UPF0145 family)